MNYSFVYLFWRSLIGYMQPVNVNRHLQSILQHPHFLRVLTSEAREAVSKLLFVMFHAYPTNSCQPSHVQPLVQLYSGTLSTSDRHIFAIIRLFEKEKKASVASIFQHWSPVGPLTAQSFLDTLSSLEPRLVFKACLDFSCRRTLAVDSEQELTAERADDGNMYDPIFVLLLFAQALSEGPPRSALAWVQLYRTNVVSLLIRCMSSAAQDIRHLAVLQLSSLWSLMQVSRCHPRVLLIAHTRYTTNSPPTCKRRNKFFTFSIFYVTNYRCRPNTHRSESHPIIHCSLRMPFVVFSTHRTSFIPSRPASSCNDLNWTCTTCQCCMVYYILAQITGRRSGLGSFVSSRMACKVPQIGIC